MDIVELIQAKKTDEEIFAFIDSHLDPNTVTCEPPQIPKAAGKRRRTLREDRYKTKKSRSSFHN